MRVPMRSIYCLLALANRLYLGSAEPASCWLPAFLPLRRLHSF
jgi:hypothetical protein